MTQQEEDAAFKTPEAMNCLDEIHRYAQALDTAISRLDALIPPPAGCVSWITRENRHGWFTQVDCPVCGRRQHK